MKSSLHLRLLTALACALSCTSALALAPRLARAEGSAATTQPHTPATSEARPAWVAAGKVVNVCQLRCERRARFEQAPAHSRRMLLPQFVLCDDAPDDDDVTEAGAEQPLYHPALALPALSDAVRSPHPLQPDQLERPPRA